MEVNFSYAPGTSLEQMIGFEIAGKIWSEYLADDVSVNIHVETTEQLPGSAIGGALPGLKTNQSYKTWRNHLANDQTSTDDQLALTHLQSDDDGFTALINGAAVEDNSKLRMTRANAKAVGMLKSDDQALDGVILMSNLTNESVSWDYDFLDGSVPKTTLDFLSVAIHEIGHVLGFVSGVDELGFLKAGLDDDDDDGFGDDDGEGEYSLDHANPLDMFRYSAESQANGVIDLSVGGNPYFSLDGGETQLGGFATGENRLLGGDGDQASHWKRLDDALGIMDPVLRVGEHRELSILDIQAMDVIGWDRQAAEIDLATLQNQAKDQLAQRLGITVVELEADPSNFAQDLTQDRIQDVQKMVKQSKVYEWGWASGNDFWWENGLWQKFSAQTIDSSPTQNESPAVSGSPIPPLSSPQESPVPPDFNLIQGSHGSDRLKGTLSHDMIQGGRGRDELYGDVGNDMIRGGRGQDKLYGDVGNDILMGERGRDHLNGGDGDDFLEGGNGVDELIGGRGDDVILGGQGRDTLTGGVGRDRFVYQSILDKGDHIQDFSVKDDVIDLHQLFDGSSHSAPEIFDQAVRWKQMGSRTVVQVKLDHPSGSDHFKHLLTLHDIAATELSSDHFVV